MELPQTKARCLWTAQNPAMQLNFKTLLLQTWENCSCIGLITFNTNDYLDGRLYLCYMFYFVNRKFVSMIQLLYFHPWNFNPLTPELNSSAQRCLTRFFTGDLASWTVHFVHVCVKNQQIHQLFMLCLVTWCARTTSLDTTHPPTILYRLLLNWASFRRH
jgi:hypothetical protein